MMRCVSVAFVGICALIAAVCAAQSTTPQGGAPERREGSSLSSEGSGLSGAGTELSGSSSGLGAHETDLGTVLSLSADVLFDFDKADLKPAATPTLQKLAELIKQKKPKQVQIHGYTDSKGTDDYNLKLSQRRAEAVAAWLTRSGVATELLATKGFGETNPVAFNQKADGSDNPDGRQKNRRVDVLLARQFSAIRPLAPAR